MNEAQSPLLWLKGRAGSGKSTICSAIIESLQARQEQEYAMVFCFFDSRKCQVSSARYILETFTYQLIEYMQPIRRGRRFSIREGEKLTEPLSLEQFQRKLRSVFLNVDTHVGVFCVLDGLSDDDGVKNVIMHEVLRVNRSRKQSHIFRCVMSSRFACEARISHEDLVQIDLNVEAGLQRDMLNFAKTRLADLSDTMPKNKMPVLALAKQLCSRANGSFLWLALAIEDIQRMENRPNLVQIVDLLPPSIDAFYQRSLQKIASQDVETAQTVFSWVTLASRPLSLLELLEALAIKANHAQFHEQLPSVGKTLSQPKTEAEIHRICGWLVKISMEGIVRLRHSTLQDYLFFAVEPSNRLHHPVLAAHELLAWSCLILLSSAVRLEVSSASTSTEPAQHLRRGTTSTLAKYAAANWSIHYRLSETYSRNLAGTLQRCLNFTLDYDCQSFSIPNSGRPVQIANTTLRISASYGLISLTQLSLQMGTDPKGGSCVLCETPLAIAAGNGHLGAANILLQWTAHPASQKAYNFDEMTRLAAIRGFTDVVRAFLECGFKVDAAEQISGKTLLHIAAESGRLSMVKLLMSYNANVNATIPKTRETPLHLAAAYGYVHIVECLVDGCDPSMRELELYNSIVRQPYYQSWTEDLLANEGLMESTVWELQARESAQEHIELLRSCSIRYSNIDLRTSAGCTALELAASDGHNDIVRFLLERKADFKSEGGVRCTALQSAIENGHLETVKILLAAGASAHQHNDGLAPTLQRASEKGHDDVADFVVWHFFNAELSPEKLSWPLSCLPTKTTNSVVRDAIHKTKLRSNFPKHGTRNVFAQRVGKLAERSR